MNKFEYENCNGGTTSGVFKIYQARNGSIQLLMGNRNIELSKEQIDKLSISLYDLIDFDDCDYNNYYLNRLPERCMKEYKFKITGGFNIGQKLIEEPAHDGSIVGFKLPDGSIARPCICLEIEDTNGEFKYVTAETEMSSLGFEGLDYDDTSFLAID